MKKISTLFLAIIMVLNVMAVPVSATESSDTKVELLCLRDKEENEEHVLKIRSVDELERYLERYEEDQTITEIKNKYDESFFEEKRLLFALVRQTGSSPQFEITSVNNTYGDIEVEIARTDEPTSPDMASWVLMFERDKKMSECDIYVNSECIARATYDTMPLESEIGASLHSYYREIPSFKHALKICSVDELEQYAAHRWFSEEFLGEHDDAFFEEKELFVAYIGYYDDGDENQILEVKETTTTVEIELEIVHPLPATTGIHELILILEMDRDMPEREIWVNSEKIAEAPYKTLKFDDVPDSAWYTDAVKFVSLNGLMNGSGGAFLPNKAMTRGMLVTVLWNSYGKPLAGESVFTDVTDDKYYAEAVNWAAEKGIVSGIGNNKFNPEGYVTREQMVTILKNFHEMWYGSSAVEEEIDFSNFEDGDSVREYAVEAMRWAVAEGIISGSENEGKRYLNPQSSSTRAQVAAVLQRYMSEYLN